MNYTMDIEKELSDELLEPFLPCRTRRQLRKKDVVKEMLKSILPFLRQDGGHPFDEIPNIPHLRDIIKLYWKWKDLCITSEIESYFEKKIIGYMLKICHYWWIKDHTTVTEIMKYFYDAYGDFREVVYGVVDDCTTWKALFRWRNWLLPCIRDKDDSENNSPLVYCLIHYDCARLRLNGIRFVDVPFSVNESYISGPADCFENAKPRELLLLLQYGASMSGVECIAAEAEICLDLLHTTLTSLQSDVDSSACREPEWNSIILSNHYWKNKMECGRILMRTTPHMGFCLNGDYSFLKNSRFRLSNLRNYFPRIIKRLLDPCDLKHLCRLRIRRILKRNWGLPNAIDRLRLPQELKNYLNLLED